MHKYIHHGYLIRRLSKIKTVFEHRYIVEKYIGRKLRKQEIVHHIDGNPLNNKLRNLYIFKNSGYHNYFEVLVNQGIINRFSLKSNLKELRNEL